MELIEAKQKIEALIEKYGEDMRLQLEDIVYDETCDEVIPVI